jgi:acyl-CoA thioesterase FadM
MTFPSVVRVRFEYRIEREIDTLKIAEGFTVHCFVSASGKPVKIPSEFRKRVAG